MMLFDEFAERSYDLILFSRRVLHLRLQDHLPLCGRVQAGRKAGKNLSG